MDVAKYSSSFGVHRRISWTKSGLKVELQGTDVFGASLVSPLSTSSASTRSNVLQASQRREGMSTPSVVVFLRRSLHRCDEADFIGGRASREEAWAEVG